MLDGLTLQSALESRCLKAQKVEICSAYFTSPAAKWLLKHLTLSADTSLIISGRKSEFLCGSSDWSAVMNAIAAGVDVHFLPGLHAKIYLFDNKDLYVGSSNLTSNGLLINGTGNIEANIHIENATADQLEFVRRLKARSTLITQEIASAMDRELRDYKGGGSPVVQEDGNDWSASIGIQKKLFVNDFLCGLDSESKYSVHKDSSAVAWLITTLNSLNGEAYFGQLTQLLHETLADDPAPYRRDVKDLLATLLRYVEQHKTSRIRVSRPNHSQKVELIGDVNGIKD